MSSYTFVTALYNIDRENKGDGRKWEEYLHWFKYTLHVNAPLVVIVPRSLEEFVKKNRPCEYISKTHIIIQEIEDIPYAYIRQYVEKTLQNQLFRSTMRDVARLECNLPLYSIVINSKFTWLKDVAILNPFLTDFFFWIDAGISRFVDIPNFVLKPNIDIPRNKMIIQCDPYIHHYSMDNYIWSNHSLTCATIFGGDAVVCQTVSKYVKNFIDEQVKSNWINNEQIIMGYFAMVLYRDLFHLVPNFTRNHLSLFQDLFT